MPSRINSYIRSVICGFICVFLSHLAIADPALTPRANNVKIIEKRQAGNLPATVTLSVLLPETGNLAQQGAEVKAALEQSVSDFNSQFSDVDLAFSFYNTSTNPNTAETVLNEINTSGGNAANLVIGPLSSGFLTASKDFAQTNSLLLYSYGSTSPDANLKAMDDNIARHIPDDSNQAPIIARHIRDQGITYVVIVNRNDTWGTNLRQVSRSVLESKEITVRDASDVPLLEYNDATLDETALTGRIAIEVQSGITGYGAPQVAVLILGFSEVATIMQAAPDAMTSAMLTPLDEVRWFGIDLISDIITNTDARNFAELDAVRYTVSTVKPDRTHSDFDRIRQVIIDDAGTSTNEPSIYPYAAYDVLQILGEAVIQADSVVTADVLAELAGIAMNHTGLMGNGSLNEYLDLQVRDDSYEIRKLVNGQWDFLDELTTETSSTLVLATSIPVILLAILFAM